MSITSVIGDGEGKGIDAGNKKTDDYGSGLKVYTFNGVNREHNGTFFINPTYGAAMNQNAASGGTPEIVNVGTTDGVYWIGSNVVGGKGNFNSGDRAYAGAVSVKWDNPNTNEIIGFNKGSDLTVAGYVSLSMWINIDKDWNGDDSIEIYGYDSGTGLQVGSSILLEDYINSSSFDVWQQATIPLVTMGLTSGTIDEIRFKLVGKSGKAPKLYIDNIQFNELGEPIQYCIEPIGKEIWKVYEVHLTMAAPYTGLVTNGTMQSIPYDGFLSLSTLAGGINLQRKQGNEIQFNITFHDFIDAMASPAAKEVISGSDGVNTWFSLTLKFPKPFYLRADTNDNIIATITDDLSSLLFFKMSVAYSKETNLQ